MSLTGIRLYAETSLLVAVALLVLWSAWAALRSREARAASWVSVAYLLLLAALVTPALAHVWPMPGAEPGPSLEVWSGPIEGADRISFALAARESGAAASPPLWSGSFGQTTIHATFLALVAASLFGTLLGLRSGGPGLLTRRIEMLANSSGRRSRWIAPAAAAIGLAAVAVVGTTANSAVADRRVARAEAASIAAVVAQRSGFTVTVDEAILEQLNLMVGAEEHRRLWQAALTRGEGLRPRLDPILRSHGLPTELTAVALVESGFRDLPPDPLVPRRGAGVWQLVPETAQHFGLKVDATSDERRDLARASDAAARYLEQLHGELGEWPLAIAAYNHGSEKVRKAISQSGSRNATQLEKAKALQP